MEIFHSKCPTLGISRVIFIDDLFILSGAHLGFLRIVLKTLKEFHSFSGL